MTAVPRELRKQQAMVTIRKLIADGYLHRDIMQQLKLPPRTYYRYLRDVYEHDSQLLREQNNADMLALEISLLVDRLKATSRTLDAIVSSPKTTVRQKIAAANAKCKIAVAILRVQYEGPLIVRKVLRHIDMSKHFNKQRFSAEEVDLIWQTYSRN
jgi:hypothetical protein